MAECCPERRGVSATGFDTGHTAVELVIGRHVVRPVGASSVVVVEVGCLLDVAHDDSLQCGCELVTPLLIICAVIDLLSPGAVSVPEIP